MYKKQEWNNGTKLDAYRLNYIEQGIYDCSKEIEELKSNKSDNDNNIFADFSEFKKDFEEFMQKYQENLDKQKKELTQLKTKLTKLSKKTSEEDK